MLAEKFYRSSTGSSKRGTKEPLGGWLVCLCQSVYDEEVVIDLLVTFNLDLLTLEVGGWEDGA